MGHEKKNGYPMNLAKKKWGKNEPGVEFKRCRMFKYECSEDMGDGVEEGGKPDIEGFVYFVL